jgi:diacylglycerol O-acyltransferase / wax synthase
MSPADAAWLRLDSPENPMVVTAVLWLGGPVDRDLLRARLDERLVAAHPRFRSVVRPRRVALLPPLWVPDPAFDLDRHLTVVDLTPGDDDPDDTALEGLVGGLLGRQLDPFTAAPWQLVLVDGYRPTPADPPRSVLVARLHHALADGSALVRLLLDLTDDPSAAPASGRLTAGDPAPARPSANARAGTALLAARLALAVPVTAVRLLLMAPEPRTPLRGRLGVRKDAAWSGPRSLDDVKAAAAAHGVTVNDVLLGAVAGGFARYLDRHGTRPLPARLRVFVPVDLGAGSPRLADREGNRFGLLPLRLPVAEPDPARRLRQIAAGTRAAKGSVAPAATFVLIGVLGVVPAVLRRLVARLLGARATAVVTNVPGPRQRLTLAGVPVDGVAFWVPQAAAVGVGVSLFSYAGTVRIGVAVDAGLVPDAQQLADALDDALDEFLGEGPSAGEPRGQSLGRQGS